ncbi:c-type cytochrome [Candidatus Laterigemmans baculatus]|uniref:c-type cytochrome n=1 Tax=Candidatus Laterigemmans baculatus TaxID=2770505 RepID=UPI001F28BB55|nr:c-type cytochrome [Candidatus Laterigemmans baculatus]
MNGGADERSPAELSASSMPVAGGEPGDERIEREETDGIEVLDSPLPGWWKWTFFATIAFSFPYFAYYHFGATGRTLEDSYTRAVARNAQLQFAEIGELEGDAETLVRYLDEPSWLSVGKSVYQTHCIACHGAGGGGLVGPNLTDEHYKNVRAIEDIVTVINVGAGAGAMPAWQSRLEQNERVLVAAYVASLRGTTPGGSPKGPEGAVIPEWPSLEELAAEEGAAEEGTAEEGASGSSTENQS